MDSIEYNKLLCAIKLTTNTIKRRFGCNEQTDRILQCIKELKSNCVSHDNTGLRDEV